MEIGLLSDPLNGYVPSDLVTARCHWTEEAVGLLAVRRLEYLHPAVQRVRNLLLAGLNPEAVYGEPFSVEALRESVIALRAATYPAKKLR